MNYYLTCINPEQNKHRFYSIAVQDGLFGDFYLIRHWGRIGTKGRSMSQGFDTLEQVQRQIDRLLQIRKRHGYSLKSST